MPTLPVPTRAPSTGVRRRLSSLSSADLVVAARSGDDEAAGELYRRTRSRARRAAAVFCGSDDADDAVAEGLTRALRRLDQLRDPAAVESWLVRCAVRAAVDLGRQRRRRRAFDTALVSGAYRQGTVESVAERAMVAFERSSMNHAVAELPQALRHLLLLRYEAGLSVDDIALNLGRPPGTVRRQCVEARRAAGQRFLYRHLRPASREVCRRVTETLCQAPYRPPAPRVRRQTSDHLRRCSACRDRQQELARLLSELGYRTRVGSDSS